MPGRGEQVELSQDTGARDKMTQDKRDKRLESARAIRQALAQSSDRLRNVLDSDLLVVGDQGLWSQLEQLYNLDVHADYLRV